MNRLLPSSFPTRSLGQEVHLFLRLGSTQETAKKLGQAGAGHGTLVLAEEQTRGRGRFGRAWHSPPGRGIWASLILRPTSLEQMTLSLGLVCALAIAEAVEETTGLTPRIKWPNDLHLTPLKAGAGAPGGTKFAGILGELVTVEAPFFLLGFGVNANQSHDEFPPELRDRATSLRIVAGQEVARAALLSGILVRLEGYYPVFQLHGLRPFYPAIVQHDALRGKRVKVVTPSAEWRGESRGVDSAGFLLLQSAPGTLRRIATGTVELIE